MHPREYEQLRDQILSFIIGAEHHIPVEAEKILRIYFQFERQLQNHYQEARMGLDMAVRQTISEAMTHAKLPPAVDIHTAKGILERASDQLSNNLNNLLARRAAPKADEQNNPQFRPG